MIPFTLLRFYTRGGQDTIRTRVTPIIVMRPVLSTRGLSLGVGLICNDDG